jgi:hypothetical protein
MADFQTAYNTDTTAINTILTTQLSAVQQWANIPGSLQKTSSSAAGYIWGYNSSNEVYVCQHPCTGKWSMVALTGLSGAGSPIKVLDIVTDETSVYILYSSGNVTFVGTKDAANQHDWTSVTVFVPTQAPSINIFSTHTYIWLQSAMNEKIKLPKPVNMSNFIPIRDKSVKITSSSPSALYGVDPTGKPMKSDEMLQTGWSPITGISGTSVKSVIGDLDQTGLFLINKDSSLTECAGSCNTNNVVPIGTQGYSPISISGDPSTNQLWMTSSTSGPVGNVFNRVGKADYSTITNAITPLDQRRDKIVGDITHEYNQQTQVLAVNKEISDFNSIFARLFGDAKKSQDSTNTEISELQYSVTRDQQKLGQVTDIQATIQKMVIALAIAALVYAVFSFLGAVTHAIVIVVLIVGIYLSLNNDYTVSSLWTWLY